MTRPLIFTVVLALAGCATMQSSLTREQIEFGSRAASLDDIESLRKLFSQTKPSQQDLSCLLNSTLQTLLATNKCPQEVVEFLLDQGAELTEYRIEDYSNKIFASSSDQMSGCARESNISNALGSYCPGIAKAVLNHATEADKRAGSVNARIQKIPNEMTTIGKKPMAETRAFAIESLGILKSLLSENCTKDGAASRSCQRLSEIQGVEAEDQKLQSARTDREDKWRAERDAEAQATKARQDFENSPAGIAEKACEEYQSIKQAEQALAHEEELTRASGIINKTNRYQNAQWKIASSNALSRLQSQYLKVTGSKVNLTKCKVENLKF